MNQHDEIGCFFQQDFINKELILFSNMDNERSIPNLMDGFKPGQRKIIFTCIKRNFDKKEIKVAQLSGSVAELSAYHHGEQSLVGAIINWRRKTSTTMSCVCGATSTPSSPILKAQKKCGNGWTLSKRWKLAVRST